MVYLVQKPAKEATFMTKRILAVVLALCLSLSLLPVTARADEFLDAAPAIQNNTQHHVTIAESRSMVAFRFIPEQTEVYTFYSESDQAVIGMLTDADGYVIEYQDGDYGNNNFSVSGLLEAGTTYYWVVRFSYSSDTGEFDVFLKTGHEMVESVITPATCTVDGVGASTCKHCGISSTYPIPAGHQWAGGQCSVCGTPFLVGGACGDNLTWQLDHTGTLTISGTGEMWDYIPFDTAEMDYGQSQYHGDPAPWKDWYADVKTLNIQPGVTYIGTFAFWGLQNLRSVALPEGVTTVEYSAFALCSTLTSVSFPSTLQNLDVCFEYSENIEEVHFNGAPPKSSGMVLMYLVPDLQIYYYSSRGSWDFAKDDWEVPLQTQWYDLDGIIAPNELTFTQPEFTVEVGSAFPLSTNADDYVMSLLTQWQVSDPAIATVSNRGVLIGLKPGTVTVTASSADSTYRISCQVTVVNAAVPNSRLLDLSGTFGNNLSRNNYEIWTAPSTSALFLTPAGGFDRVEYVEGTGIVVARYDASLNPLSEQTIQPELPLYGGSFSGSQYNFLLYGQNNPTESNGVEVLRIVRYTKDWQRLDHCSVYGANTTIPFNAGGADFSEANGRLYLHTCHEMYTTEDGKNHQANMTFVLDIASMAVVDQWYDIMNVKWGYVSHSFSQYVQADQEYLFRLDHGDDYPRSVVLTRSKTDQPVTDVSYLELLQIEGAPGANATGVSLGGMALSPYSVLVVGNSVPQNRYYTANSHRNIFLAVTDRDMTGSDLIWLTSHTEKDDITVRTPQIIAVTADTFLILWEQLDPSRYISVRTCAMLVNSEGSALCDPVEIDVRLSDCQPVVTGDGLVTWYVTDGTTLRFYQLSWRQLIAAPAALDEVLGHLYADQIREPTCTEGGCTIHYCTRCGMSETHTPTEALGHAASDWLPVQAPTCTMGGREYTVCTRCGEYDYRDVGPLGHDYTVHVNEPSCTQPGFTEHRCPRCNHSYRDSETEPLGHAWGEWYVQWEPSCNSSGEEWRRCTRDGCNYADSRELPPTGHQYIPNVKEPTCTEGGHTYYWCSCGDSYTGDYTDPLGHTYGEWYTYSSASCTSDGEERRDCIRCRNYESRTVPGGDHVYNPTVTPATCTEGGYTTYACACGDRYVADQTPALGHELGEWTITEAATCLREGEETRSCTRCSHAERRTLPKTDHNFVTEVYEPTCTSGGYTVEACEGCGTFTMYNFTPALGHRWQNSRCVRCGVYNGNPFRDVEQDDFFYEPVLWAVSQGITTGTGAETFSPDDNCTRAQVVTFLWRTFGKPEPESRDNPFSDVEEDDYFYDAVLWAVEQGITTGTGGGKFSPDEECTRAQVVTFLWRTFDKPEPWSDDNPFSDVEQDDYFYDAVLWAVEWGITTGTGKGRFSPGDSCTRGQVVTFLYRTVAE